MIREKILIVDDDIGIINTMVDILSRNSDDYEIFQTVKSTKALEIAKNKLPDLIIADWQMPKISGIELICELKLIPELQQIPVIICTGSMTKSEDLKTALEAGAVDFIRKPIDETELVSRVKSMLLISNNYKEIKAQKEEIEKQGIFMKTLLDTVPYPGFYYTKDGLCKGFNRKFNDEFHAMIEKPLEISVYQFFINDGVDIHIKNDKIILETGDFINYESSVTYADKEKHDILFSKAAFKNPQNEIIGIICLMIDISEIKATTAKIIESQKRELAAVALRLLQAYEMNEKVISDIKQINQHTDKKGNDLINSLIGIYRINSGESAWDEFDIRFKQVYNNFYENLNKKFPELTLNERKLCAFIRLDMTTKDIASVTFQNPESIDMARYRLRKKLNLSKDDNLNAFISSI